MYQWLGLEQLLVASLGYGGVVLCGRTWVWLRQARVPHTGGAKEDNWHMQADQSEGSSIRLDTRWVVFWVRKGHICLMLYCMYLQELVVAATVGANTAGHAVSHPGFLLLQRYWGEVVDGRCIPGSKRSSVLSNFTQRHGPDMQRCVLLPGFQTVIKALNPDWRGTRGWFWWSSQWVWWRLHAQVFRWVEERGEVCDSLREGSLLLL